MAKLTNTPQVRLGVVGVSRDCFPASLTRRRTAALMAALRKAGLRAHRSAVVVESDADAVAALDDLAAAGCNAAVIYLGNFGPEGPTALLAQRFGGPVMVCAAAEENKAALVSDRGDALCGLLSVSYNLGLRGVRAYIPSRPVGLPQELAPKVADFEAAARVVLGVRNLKIFSFGPRPQDFLTCHAPLQPLMDLGVEVMENSELDLHQLYESAAGNKRAIGRVAAQMKRQLGRGCTWPDLLPKMAQLEVALVDFMAQNLGASAFAVFANKCWPAFEPAFGFTPCYVNSRMAAQGIPAACEVDLYGGLSEYMVQLASLAPATLLDVNNSVPDDLLPKRADLKGADRRDLFMGFHCGNTPAECMKSCTLKYQLIMNRLMENGRAPDITRGTLEGQIRPGPMTLFRLQSTPDCWLRSYVAEGEFLDVDPQSFGAVGIVAIPQFARFYRHVLIEKRFPHHAAVGFEKVGRVLFEAARLLGVDDVWAPLGPSVRYEGENPFEPTG